MSILSSVPPSAVDTAHLDDYTNAYQRLSGTSMATPYAAGVAALVLQARPGLKPHEVKVAFMNTADALATEYSVFEMGAGQLDRERLSRRLGEVHQGGHQQPRLDP